MERPRQLDRPINHLCLDTSHEADSSGLHGIPGSLRTGAPTHGADRDVLSTHAMFGCVATRLGIPVEDGDLRHRFSCGRLEPYRSTVVASIIRKLCDAAI